jgi:hypothetical protein
MVQKPVDTLTLSAADGEALIARVHRSNVPRADAAKVAWGIRMYVSVGCARQEAKGSMKRLRAVLWGPPSAPSPGRSPEGASASDPADGGGTSPAVVLEADADGGGATAQHAPPGESQTLEQTKPTGGPRPGTGRLGADTYGGAERVECRHEDRAAGQRCPGCGQGSLEALPPGVEIRIDGQALRSALRYQLDKRRCSACGQIFPARVPEDAGEDTYSPRARAGLAVGRYLLGLPCYRLEA